jgi:hypothetical protein
MALRLHPQAPSGRERKTAALTHCALKQSALGLSGDTRYTRRCTGAVPYYTARVAHEVRKAAPCRASRGASPFQLPAAPPPPAPWSASSSSACSRRICCRSHLRPTRTATSHKTRCALGALGARPPWCHTRRCVLRVSRVVFLYSMSCTLCTAVITSRG